MSNLTTRTVRPLAADDYIYSINNAGTVEGRSLASDLLILAGGSSSNKETITQTSHGLSFLNAVLFDGVNYIKAQANNGTNASVVGVVDSVTDSNTFSITYGGIVPWAVNGVPDRTSGNDLWLSPNTSGLVVDTEPTFIVGQVRQYIGEALLSGLLVNMDVGQVVSEGTGTFDLVGFGATKEIKIGTYNFLTSDYGVINDKTIVYTGSGGDVFTNANSDSLTGGESYVYIEHQGTGILEVKFANASDVTGAIVLGRKNKFLSPGEIIKLEYTATANVWNMR